jgi:type II secretory pathway component PulK
MVLILVIVILIALLLAVYAFSRTMITYDSVSRLTGKQIQAGLLMESGVESARSFLRSSDSDRQDAGGIWNNYQQFQAIPILLDSEGRAEGCCSLLAPNINDEGNYEGVRFGLQDESTRLNLNVVAKLDEQQSGVGRALLMGLPGMTADIADAILDWMDADDQARENGCEESYYSRLNPPYAPKNGPLDTIEELLLVRGVTPQLLFGMDINRNYAIDDNEAIAQKGDTSLAFGDTASSTSSASGSSADSATAASGGFAAMAEETSFDGQGWADYLTLYSREKNITPDGQPRIFLNGTDAATLYADLSAVLPADLANFIVLYRLNGPGSAPNTPNANIQKASGITPNLTNASMRASFVQALDVVDAWVVVPATNGGQQTYVQSPIQTTDLSSREKLMTLMDMVTVNKAESIPGRININLAPANVLRGIPGMSDAIVEKILSKRDLEGGDDPNRRHEVWLLSEGIVTLQEMKTLLPFMTGGGHVFRTQSVGYFTTGDASARAEVVIDATRETPRILLWKDLSHLGRGYTLETLGLPGDALLAEETP